MLLETEIGTAAADCRVFRLEREGKQADELRTSDPPGAHPGLAGSSDLGRLKVRRAPTPGHRRGGHRPSVGPLSAEVNRRPTGSTVQKLDSPDSD